MDPIDVEEMLWASETAQIDVEEMSCERDGAGGPDRWLRECPASETTRMDQIDG